MNIIHVFLLVGIWVITIAKGISLISLRDEYIKAGVTEKPKKLKEAQKSFMFSLVCAIIYTIIKLR